jgi:hypothetical protein
MILSTLRNWLDTARSLLTSPRALAVFAGLYALLLVSLGGFIKVREATVWQVLITFALLVLVPVEFFILQSAIVTRARDGGFQWGRIARIALKLAVVTIPMILFAYLLYFLLNKWQAHYPPPIPVFDGPNGLPRLQPTHRPTLLFGTLRSLLFGIALPLATIHLWLEVAAHDVKQLFSGGAKPFFKRIGNVFARAFGSDSVLTYALGLIVFVVLPFAVLFGPPSVIKGNKTEFAVFSARLILAFAFTLIGWVVTLSALTKLSDQEVPVVTAQPVAAAEAPA